MRVTLVVDNLANDGLRSEHGLSFLIESNNGSVVFDVGQSNAWFDNLLDLEHTTEAIKAIALSHGHYDHTGGLTKACQELPHAKYFAHPACFAQKYAQSSGEMRYIGMPAEALSLKPWFTLSSSALEVLPGVKLSGEIPMRKEIAFDNRFRTGREGAQQDTFEDEQCMIVQNGDSVAVIVGCAHRGLENNILAALDVAKVSRIDLLVGGFHLTSANEERLRSLADFLENIEIGRVACCHCTGSGAYGYLSSRLGARIDLAEAGMSWEI